jgi:digeranylgeranylglycerophospholipid reductase
VGNSLPKIVGDGIALIGDAAHHSDPISGGGVANAMYSGQFAAEATVEAVRIGDLSTKALSAYQKRWDKEIGRNFKHICRIRDGVLKFSDDLFDKCAEVVSKMPPEKVNMTQIFKTVLKHQPRLLLELRHLILAGWL